MRIVLQRVKNASVTIDGNQKSAIDRGLLVLVGFESEDSTEDLQWICKKILSLRIFNDEAGKMNFSVQDIEGEILLVSQFTLHASTKKGNRPSFIKAAKPDISIPLYEQFVEMIKSTYQSDKIQTGEFGADMKVELLNDGPVTIIMDSKQRDLF